MVTRGLGRSFAATTRQGPCQLIEVVMAMEEDGTMVAGHTALDSRSSRVGADSAASTPYSKTPP